MESATSTISHLDTMSYHPCSVSTDGRAAAGHDLTPEPGRQFQGAMDRGRGERLLKSEAAGSGEPQAQEHPQVGTQDVLSAKCAETA